MRGLVKNATIDFWRIKRSLDWRCCAIGRVAQGVGMKNNDKFGAVGALKRMIYSGKMQNSGVRNVATNENL
jgi:hypothetical protein